MTPADTWTETDDVAMQVWCARQALAESEANDSIPVVGWTITGRIDDAADNLSRSEHIPVGIYGPPLTPPQHSRVGIAIGLVLAFALTVAGFLLALAAPALSGGTLSGMALVALGGAGCARIVHTTRRTEA